MPNSADADIDRRVKVTDGEGNDDRSIERVSDLRAMPFVVLLGEPGIGKSTVLAREAANEGASMISVRELMTGTRAQPDATLFLDALDEYRTDGGAEYKVHTLANAIAGCNPPRWRLTCRSEDWRKAADIAPISKTTAGQSHHGGATASARSRRGVSDSTHNTASPASISAEPIRQIFAPIGDT